MKALSGYAEWFWLMCKNWKDVENRNWPLPQDVLRQLPCRIYLHASKTKTPIDEYNFITSNLSTEQYEEFRRVEWEKLRGHIIGEVTITGYSKVGRHIVLLAGVGHERSKWLFGEYGFWVQDSKLYDKPVTYRGQLGFFEVKL